MKRFFLMIIPALICGMVFTSCSSIALTDDDQTDEEIVNSVGESDEEDDDGWSGPYVVTWDELKGTKWKLYSIDHNARGRKMLEPEDCETCYTLTFDKDETGWFFSGVSIKNSVNIRMKYNGFNHYVEVLITGEDEPFDGNLFCSTLKLVEIIDCDGRFFGLHFNDCGGFLSGHGNCNGVMLFKRIEQ